MRNLLSTTFVLIFLFCCFSNAFATNLFDSKRGVVTKEETKKVQKPAKAKPKVKNVSYKLIAISKIASKYNLTFENIRKRDKIHTKWEKGSDSSDSPIPEYYIYDVVNRRVLFKAINSKTFRCHESKKEKVTCDPKNKIIAYELVTNKPVRTASVKKPKTTNKKKKPVNNKNKKNTKKNTKQPFQPKRIEPKDIPDDMRLIKTPFGDRLVPK